MRYKVLLRNGGSRVYNDYDQLIEMLREARISTDLSWDDKEAREQIVIQLWRDGNKIGVVLKMDEMYKLDR